MKQLCLLAFSVLVLISCKSKAPQVSAADSLNGKWKYAGSSEKNYGMNALGEMPELILDAATNRISGNTGCNTVLGSYTINGNAFSFGPLAGTRKMCGSMELETYLLQFFANVGSYKIDEGRLFLYDKGDKSKFIAFTKVKPS